MFKEQAVKIHGTGYKTPKLEREYLHKSAAAHTRDTKSRVTPEIGFSIFFRARIQCDYLAHMDESIFGRRVK